ncbi:MAG: DUF6268 family outer membrane beta-barrel protein [Bacteroidota bacterium]
MIRSTLLGIGLLIAATTTAQQTDTTEVEDFSQYADAELAGDARRFATQKVLDQSPNKLISIGYDLQGSYFLDLTGPGSPERVNNSLNSGLRLAANVPVISRNNIIVNLGGNYWETRYRINNGENASNPLARSLARYGLRTLGLSTTVFKPLDEKRLLLVVAQADLNGNYSLAEFQSLKYTRYSLLSIYGWKKHDRLIYGFGLARTYRAGERNVLPLFMYNYTFPSRKWGVEAIFPARAHLRRTFNPRSMGFFGYELEGQTYRIANRGNEFGQVLPNANDLELRRSEMRIRLMYECSIKDFIWLSVQAGLRYNWRFNMDRGDISRGFTGDQPYLAENKIGNPLYINFSINLVSP